MADALPITFHHHLCFQTARLNRALRGLREVAREIFRATHAEDSFAGDAALTDLVCRGPAVLVHLLTVITCLLLLMPSSRHERDIGLPCFNLGDLRNLVQCQTQTAYVVPAGGPAVGRDLLTKFRR